MSVRTTNWLVPLLLLLLGALNIASGAFQLTLIGQGPTPEVLSLDFASPQYFTTPLPILIHIVTGITFNLLAPLQFVPAIRRRWPVWHRRSGRLLIVAGVGAGLSGLWMNQFFPAFGTGLKYAAVITFGVGIVVALGLGLRAALRRDISRHRVWMMRAVAMSLGPAVQRLILLPMFLVFGEPPMLVIESVVWLSYFLNLAVVEWVLRRPRRRPIATPMLEELI